jgi:hypothetical protein
VQSGKGLVRASLCFLLGVLFDPGDGHNIFLRNVGKLVHDSKYCEINSVALVRERTIPTERPPLVGEVSVNFCGQGVSLGQRNGFPRSLISVFLTEAASFSSK